MNSIIITQISQTYAIKLKKLLLREGIRAGLYKAVGSSEGDGCTHGVEISEADLYRAVVFMKSKGIDYRIERKRTK